MYQPNEMLSKYFRQREIGKSSTADRYGIRNEPTDSVIEHARLLAENVLDPIREHFGSFSPQSWYRSEELERIITEKDFIKWCTNNRLDHSLPGSWDAYFKRKSHPLGQAADIEIVGVSNDELFDWISVNLKFDQLIREFRKTNDPRSGWVHVSWSLTNRNQKFNI